MPAELAKLILNREWGRGWRQGVGYRARSARWAMVMGAATTQWPMPTATWPTWPVYCFWPTCVVSPPPSSHIIVALVADAAAIVVAMPLLLLL